VRFRSLSICAFALIAVCAPAQPRRTLDVPYLPTTPDAVAAMLKLAHVTAADVLYDLGCGDGRIVIAAAKTYGAHAVGVDIDPDRIMEARENAKKAGVERLVRFDEKDLFQTDVHEATVVTLFLLSSVNRRLRPKLLQQLKPGTRIVSNTFMMGDWKPDRERTVGGQTSGDFSRQIYLWIVPYPRVK
jgi:SAM-dependent methyltransferase